MSDNNKSEERELRRKQEVSHGSVGRIDVGGNGDFNLTKDLEALRQRERKAVGLR